MGIDRLVPNNKPLPYSLSLISDLRRIYETEGWRVYSSKLKFEDKLNKLLVLPDQELIEIESRWLELTLKVM